MRRFFPVIFLMMAVIPAFAQEVGEGPVEVNYDRPVSYIIGGVTVEGNRAYGAEQIISLSGLRKGSRVTVPSEELSSVTSRLWHQRYFEDVALQIDHLSAEGASAFFKIVVTERPRVSAWLFTGVKKGEKKELDDRLSLRPGRECSDYVLSTSTDIIKRFYAEKGFQNEPQRCKSCRNAKKNAGKPQREMHTAICANCGKEAKIPFEPTSDRPVYCSECYAAMKEGK